jgi:flagellar FliL protein
MKNFIRHFLVQFVSILACLAIVGAVMIFVRPRLGKHGGARGRAAEAAPAAREAGVNVELEEFTVNLADTDQARFLKIKIVVVVPGQEAARKIEEFKPQIRHAIIMTLTRQYFHALQSPEGKEQLKDQIKKHANETLEPSGIALGDVLFTDFVMQ